MNKVVFDSPQFEKLTRASECKTIEIASRLDSPRLLKLFCCIILALTIVISSSPSFGQMCSGSCGDANGTNSVNITDMFYTLNWLRVAGAPAPHDDILCASTDGCDLVTIRDCIWTKRYIYNGGNPPDCSGGPKYVPFQVPAFLTLYYHANVFPINASEVTITLLLDFPLWPHNIEGFSLPIRFEVGGVAPNIISVTHPVSSVFSTQSVANDIPGSVRLVGMTNPINGVPPGRYKIANVKLGLPAVPFGRYITLHWAELPPMMNGAVEPPNSPVNYTMVVDTTLQGWIPETYGYICGDVDANLIVSISDAVYLINYIFAGGPPPILSLLADVSCDGLVSISDAVYVINYIFNGGIVPCNEC